MYNIYIFFKHVHNHFLRKQKIILVKNITDKFLDQIDIAIKKIDDVTIVLIAGALEKKIKNKKFF